MTGMLSLRAAGVTRGTGQSITPRLAVQVGESRLGQVPDHDGIHRVLLGGGSCFCPEDPAKTVRRESGDRLGFTASTA